MTGGPYKLLSSLRFWNTRMGPEGACALVRMSVIFLSSVLCYMIETVVDFLIIF